MAGGSSPQGGFMLGNLGRWVEAQGSPSRGLPKQITERGQAGAGLIEERALPGWKSRGPT